MDNNNKWDELSLTEKSEIMRQAVANGITDLNEIRQTYNEYADGGSMDNGVTENKEAVAAAKEKYPMLRGLDFSVYSDPNYRASDYDGYGDIEVFYKGEQKVDYTPEYSYPNPNINQDNVLYNPNRIPEKYTQDAINLDAISHLGHNDPTYDALNATIGNEYPDAATSEMLPLYEKMTGKNLMKMPDSKRPSKDKWVPEVIKAWDDAPQRYQNAIDGLVRDYIISKEHPNPNDPIYKGLNYVQYNPQWDSENNSPFYLNQLYEYITTGRRPANILPEVTVTGHKHAGGGRVAHDARYNHATQIYQSYINQGVNPQTALELTNQKIAEKGWTGWVSGDNKRYNNVNSFTDHTIDQFNRLYPDSLKSNNFNQFFQGIEGGRTKYNPSPNTYRQHLLQTRPGVKKRINEYRRLQGQSPLSLVSPASTPLPWEEGILYNPQLPVEEPVEQPVIAADGGQLFARGGKLSQQNQRAGYAVDYFINKGLSREAAAGLVGNLMRESKMNANAINPASGAYGLGQWLGDRKTKLFKKYGRNPSFNQQLDYIWDELNTSHRKGLQMLKSSKTVDEAARNAFGYYEFSAGPQAAVAAMNRNGKNTRWKNPNGTYAMNQGINNAWVAYGKANPNAKFQGLNANSPVLGYNRTMPNYNFTSAVDGLNVEGSIANFSGETPKFQYDLFPPNPTDYGTPIDWSTPEKKVETPTIAPKEDNNGLGLLALINQIYDNPKEQSLATYTPQRNNNMFVVSAPTSNDSFLDIPLFNAYGGKLFAKGGDKEDIYDLKATVDGKSYPARKMNISGKELPVFLDTDNNKMYAVDDNKTPFEIWSQYNLPEVTVTPSAKKDNNTGQYFNNEAVKYYDTAFHPEDTLSFINTITLGGLNNLSPTQWLRRAYDAKQVLDKNMSVDEYADNWINGNNGIVPDAFASNHPYLSLGANLIGDAGIGLGTYQGTKLTGRYKSLSNQLNDIPKGRINDSSDNFVSELDWSPENWFKTRENGAYDANDIASLKSHIPEYHKIEQEAKANGTWLKMPDGSTWNEDPRSWVQLQSKEGQKLMQKPFYHGDTYVFRNIDDQDVTPERIGEGVLWSSSNKHLPQTYGNHHYILSIPKDTKMESVDAKGRNWRDLEGLGLGYKDTNDISYDLLNDDNAVEIKNVLDMGSDPRWSPGKNGLPKALPKEEILQYGDRVFKGNDYIFGENTPRKSLLGNNGDFNLLNPNIYKATLPWAIPAFLWQYYDGNSEIK